ncbi:MAG: hypothetical protein KGI19_11105, partial [Thaumarchaeota archaeon]|nr:hypothetical protein [Nitrososphaerota archaeon]
FAQYGYTQGNSMTVEQEIELAKKKVELVKAHPGDGSGTPYLDAKGVNFWLAITGAEMILFWALYFVYNRN